MTPEYSMNLMNEIRNTLMTECGDFMRQALERMLMVMMECEVEGKTNASLNEHTPERTD